MNKEAQNIKISAVAWNLLRWAKGKLKVKTYSDVIIKLDRYLQSTPQLVQISLKNFNKDRHKISVKTPEDEGSSTSLEKPKTIILTTVAHDILFRIKVESTKSAYTFSDAIEFLIKYNSNILGEIPSWMKN